MAAIDEVTAAVRFERKLNVRAPLSIIIRYFGMCPENGSPVKHKTRASSANRGFNCRHFPVIRNGLASQKALRPEHTHATLDVVSKEKKKRKGASWIWPLGVLGTGVAGAAVVVLRGCWHRKMSWPIRIQGYSYQVCLGCGIKRLFDEATFRGYGAYSYDLDKLIARERAARMKQAREAARPA